MATRFKTIFVSWPRSVEDRTTTTRFSQRGVSLPCKMKKKKKNHHAWKVCVHHEERCAYRRKKSISYLEPSLLEMNPSPIPLISLSTSFILLFLIGRWANTNPPNPPTFPPPSRTKRRDRDKQRQRQREIEIERDK